MRPLALSVLLVAVLAACDATAPQAPTASATAPVLASAATEADVQGRTLAAIRRATARYQRVDRALADGYAPVSGCVASPAGGMGVHYLNPARLDGTVDPAAPEILLYEPQPNGRLRLVGVEFMVPAAPGDDGSNPPTLDGVAFDVHIAPEARHGLPFPHYDLHVWTWRHNPSGTFMPFNPKVSCDHAG